MQESRLIEVLTAYFDASESGGSPDLDELCGGDAELRARVEAHLERDPLARASASESAVESEELAQPRRLGDFTLIEKIGSGGMGEVFLARQESLERLVALKVLKPDVVAERRARLRFQREATIMAGLDHPNIVPIHEIGEESGHSYIAMKWLTGPTLEEAAGSLNPIEVAQIGAKIARGLEEAHRSGVLHRDVKPANIILDSGEPFLVDFGLALSHKFDARLSQPGATAGTLAYMSPEQLSDAHPHLDPRTDVYSLGAALYEGLAGRPPFPEDVPARLIVQILRQDAPPLRLERAHRDLESIILRALEKRLERRFDSAAEFAEDLGRYLAGIPTLTRPIGRGERVRRAVVRHPVAAAGAALVIVVLLGFVAYAGHQSRERDRRIEAVVNGARRDAGHARIRRALTRVESQSPSDRMDSRVVRLMEALRARDEIEQLLDLLAVRPHLVHPSALDARATAVEGGVGHWPRVGALSLIAADLYRERLDRARVRLDALEASAGITRASNSIRQALLGGEFTAPEVPAASMLDHTITIMAMRLVDANPALIERELELAAMRDEGEPRYGLAVVFHRYESGDLAGAEGALTLVRARERESGIVLQVRAWLATVRGRYRDALAMLDETAPEEPTAWRHALRVLLLVRTGENAEAESLLEDASAMWPDDPHLRLIGGQLHAARGDWSTALDLLKPVADDSAWPHTRGAAAGYLLLVELAELELGDIADDEDWEDVAEDAVKLRRRAERLAEDARDPLARARALYVQSVVHQAEGDVAGGLRLLRLARSASPFEHLCRIRLAELTYVDLVGSRSLDESQWRRTHEARRAIEEVFDHRGGAPSWSPEEELLAWCLRAGLAKVHGDVDLLESSVLAAEKRGEALGWPAMPDWKATIAAFRAGLSAEPTAPR